MNKHDIPYHFAPDSVRDWWMPAAERRNRQHDPFIVSEKERSLGIIGPETRAMEKWRAERRLSRLFAAPGVWWRQRVRHYRILDRHSNPRHAGEVIIADRAAGFSWSRIARKCHRSVAMAKRIERQYKDRQALSEQVLDLSG